MVLVDTKKFACKSCIQGHRSSSCAHANRPLFEIKKKGRPISQCEECRELRQNKRVHSKCKCRHGKGDEQSGTQSLTPGGKPRRFVPIVPALPNGLRDTLQSSEASSSSSCLQLTGDALFNPCNCKNIRKCKCRKSLTSTMDGLAVLARAAAICGGSENGTPQLTSAPSTPREQHKRPGSPADLSHKHTRRISSPPNEHDHVVLPPIHLQSSSPQNKIVVPTFPTMPPITSHARSGCTCGFQCRCPGCVLHRGREHASKDHSECAHGCGTCIDYEGGISLPSTSSSTSGSSNDINIVDRFFSLAAALPLPPTNRQMGVRLDPMSLVSLYPEGVGQVNLPKLKCCGGRCECPGGRCGCGETCDGDCSGEHYRPDLLPSLPRSCCARKRDT